MFTRRGIAGCVTPSADRPVRVSLSLNGRPVAATWAVERPQEATDSTRRFHFVLKDIWKYVGQSGRLQIQAEGVALPVSGGVTVDDVYSGAIGKSKPKALFKRLEEGFVFNKKGKLQLSKLKNLTWQTAIHDGYEKLNADFERLYGYRLFPCYGSLLGAVREQNFIGHDDDFDCAYISKVEDPAKRGLEMKRIARELIKAGYRVSLGITCIHVNFLPKGKGVIDIFNAYFDDAGRFILPFGLAGDTPYTRDDFTGWEPVRLGDRDMTAPAHPEKLLAWIYGANWRIPDPTFNWARQRKIGDKTAFPARNHRRDIYWDNRYAHETESAPSDFARLVMADGQAHGPVIDLGCGSGADAMLLATSSPRTRVLGLDRCSIAINKAAGVARRTPALQLKFEICDVTYPARLTELVSAFRRDPAPRSLWSRLAGPPRSSALFFSRSLLNAINEPMEANFFKGLRAVLSPGDRIAMECVVKSNAALATVHRRSFGRVVDPEVLARRIARLGLKGPVKIEVLHLQDGSSIARVTGTK